MRSSISLKNAENVPRVIVLSHFKPCQSGYADYVYNLISNLAEISRHKISLIVLGCKCGASFKANEAITNITVKRVWRENSISSLVKLIINMVREAKVGSVLYMYYPLEYFTNLQLAPLLNLILPLIFLPVILLKRIKLLIDLDSIHKPSQLTLLQKAYMIIEIMVLKVLQKIAKAVIVCRNIIMKEILLQMGFEKSKVRYIPHGVPIPQPIPKTLLITFKKTLNVENKRVILYLGFISKYKGIDYAIKAMDIIRRVYPNVTLIIAGDYFNPLDKYAPHKHRYLPYLKQLVKSLNLENHVIFITKHLSEEEMKILLEITDVVVLPYVTKNLSSSGILAQAMSYGKPVVVTNCGWFHGYVYHGFNGLIVPERDVNSLAQAILEVLEDSNIAEALRSNMIKVSKKMQWNKVAMMWYELIVRMLREQ